MVYSATVFTSTGLTGAEINALCGGVNFITACLGCILLGYFGRKTLMSIGNIGMAGCLLGLGFCLNAKQESISVGLVMGFLTCFEFSSGPITWLYMAEVMQDKAQSIATVMNWFVVLVIAIVTPYIVDWAGDDHVGYIFLFLGGVTVISTLFVFCQMKETMGKSPQEIEELFTKNRIVTQVDMNANTSNLMSNKVGSF